MADHDVTIGEIYRRLCGIDARHGAQLTSIIEQQWMANQRTSKLETWAARIDERVGGMERHSVLQDQVQSTAPDLSGDIRIPVNAKTITAILCALAALIVAYFTKAG